MHSTNPMKTLFFLCYSYGFQWDITFLAQIGNIPLLSAISSDNWAGTNPVLKVLPLRDGVAPLSGTFRVGYEGVMTPPLDAYISAGDMKAALEALPTISEVSVARFSNGYGFDYRVTFLSELGNLNLMVVNDASLSGPFAAATVTTALDGVLPANYSMLIIQDPTSQSAVVSSLTQGSLYQARVRSHNVYGYSYFTLSSPSFLSPKSAPSPPYDITMYALSDTSIRIAWTYPLNDGGAPIIQYTVQWDVTNAFTNAVANGNSVTLTVAPGDGPVFCYTIIIAASSASIARFARVSAFNGFSSSPFGLPTPASATGQVLAPGAPTSVSAFPTDAVGIIVNWSPPNSLTCLFGGDGGSAVTFYSVEWDLREDFSTPASQSFVYDLSNLSFLIGGRDIMTGKESTELIPGGSYYVRVTAFNAVGAGIAGYAFQNPVELSDQPPLPPLDLTLDVLSATQLFASWDHPLRDGGTTLEKYRLEYTTDESFGTYTSVDLPLVSEVQAVVISAPVLIDTQSITLAAQVTNERQIVRSTLVPAVDEMQTVTLFSDNVENEVQRLITTAIDVNAVQSVELTGTEVHEVQLIQSRTLGVPEIQTVDVSSERINAVQNIGVIVSGLNTSSCTTGSPCPSVESGFTGVFVLQFDPNQCGTFSDTTASNWCTIALNDAGITGYDCSATSCLTPFISVLDSAATVQSALCNLQGSGSTTFMTSPDGLCVNVSRTAFALNANATSGEYMILFSIEFNGAFVRGNVPALLVTYSNVTYSTPGVAFIDSTTNSSSGLTTTLGSVDQVGNIGYMAVEGNQPDGLFTLTYFCEARVVLTIVNVTAVSASTSLITVPGSGILQVYEYIRIQQTYHQIISVDATGTVGTITPAFDLTPYAGIFTFANALVGAFYSDPYDIFGVSAACYTSNIYVTLPMNQSEVSADMSAKLRALSPVVVDTDDSLTITRSYYSSTSNRIGYIWTITFNRQNGDLIPLLCGTAQLFGTNSIGGASCFISTVRNGTLIDGSFAVGVTSPNAYISTPLNYSSISVPWNIDPFNFGSILSSTTGFGAITVNRQPYFADQIRWSGGYLWTVSFVGRFGAVPSMTIQNNLTLSAAPASNTTITVGTGDNPLAFDDPGTAVVGNQVGGFFGFSFTDTDTPPTFYQSSATAFSVVSNITGQAISAAEFQAALVAMLNGLEIVEVSRSATPNAVMGYTYLIEFTGEIVGGNVQNLSPITTNLTHTTTASSVNSIGDICTNAAVCTLGSYVINTGILVSTVTEGAQLQGSFQLLFGSSSTGPLAYNAAAIEVESAINNLESISPSRVIVTRFGPMRTPSTQTFGYVWEITFDSNTWIDPRVDHSVYFLGNWQGAATTWDAVWETGFSRAWGRQVGDQPLIVCSASGLYSTNGVLPASACLVDEMVAGTTPLSGSFTLTLNTIANPVINIQAVLTTGPIAFNAFANSTESGGDGTSVQERLSGLPNAGVVSVARSDVDRETGAFTYFITFLRDVDSPGGQWDGQCQQKDSYFNLCNSPGNVPSLVFNQDTLSATCISSPAYTCPLGLVMTGDSPPNTEPGGSREVQDIYVSNPSFDANFTAGLRFFTISFNGTATGDIAVNSSAAQVQSAIEDGIPSLQPNVTLGTRGVIVSKILDPVLAPNGGVFRVRFVDEVAVDSER